MYGLKTPDSPDGQAPDTPEPKRLLTRDEVEACYGISKRWLEIAACRGSGPPLIRISPRMVRYRASDIETWIESCAEPGREGGGAV